MDWKKKFLERLLNFSVSVVLLANKLPKTPTGFAIASQIVRSGTAVGANVEEAQDASSNKDFIQKLSISLREAKETLYWLEVIKLSKLLSEELLEKEYCECREIVAILVSSVKKSRLKL